MLTGALLLYLAAGGAAAATWKDSLTASGFTMEQGQYGYFGMPECAGSDTCYAINPLTPYGLAYFRINDTATEANYSNSCFKHKQCVDGRGPAWRVGVGESILFVGRTPPKATYWSFSNYMYSRYHEPGWKSSCWLDRPAACLVTGCPAAGPGGDRCEVFAGINDPVNMLSVRTQDGRAYNASFAMLLSFDSASEAAVTAALSSDAGFPSAYGALNYLRYPGALLNLGRSTGKEDEMMNVLRLEGVDDDAARDEFYQHTPLEVYRLTPPAGVAAAAAGAGFASFDGRMRERWTGEAESAPGVSNAALRSAVAELEKKVVSRHAAGNDHARIAFSTYVNDSGYECLRDGSQCQGDCRDTIYAKATFEVGAVICNKTGVPCPAKRQPALTDEPDDHYMVLGVNHKATNQSVYASVTAYSYPKLASVGVVTDDHYGDSAARYLGSGHPAAPYLYVVKFARTCAADEPDVCVALPAKVPPGDSQEPLPLDSPVVWIERMYIRPATGSGPAVSETILPVLIHFRKGTKASA